jgi:hypothetical protein
MANELSCYEQAVRKADERGALPAFCANVLADTAGEPNPTTARYEKLREPTLGGGDAPSDPLAPAPVQDGDPPALAMSGEDFYRAACVQAHARLLNLP